MLADLALPIALFALGSVFGALWYFFVEGNVEIRIKRPEDDLTNRIIWRGRVR